MSTTLISGKEDFLKVSIPFVVLSLFLISLSYMTFADVWNVDDTTTRINVTFNDSSSAFGAAAAGVYYNNTGTVNFTFYTYTNDEGPTNATLFINISGLWQGNETNATSEFILGNSTLNWINATLPDGVYIWNVNVSNASNVAATEGTWNMSMNNASVVIDSTAPTIGIITPVAHANMSFRTTEINITITDNLVGVNTTYVWYTFANETNNYSISSGLLLQTGWQLLSVHDNSSTFYNNTLKLNSSNIADGNYTLYINATDVFNNTIITAIAHNVTIDNTPPTYVNASVMINATGGTPIISLNTSGESISINVSWVDNISRMDTAVLQMIGNDSTHVGGGNDWYNLTYNTTLKSGWSQATYSQFIFKPIKQHGDRNLTFRILANDTSGNTNTTMNVTVMVNDTTAPTIAVHTIDVPNSFVTNANLSGGNGNGLEIINLTVDDQNGSGIDYSAGVQMTITNKTGDGNTTNYTITATVGWTNVSVIPSTNQTNFSITINVSKFADGNYTVYINATDKASNRPHGGNNVTTAITGIIIDNTGLTYYNGSGEDYFSGSTLGGFNVSSVNDTQSFNINITWNSTIASGSAAGGTNGSEPDTVILQKYNISTNGWDNVSNQINASLKTTWGEARYSNFTANSSIIEGDTEIIFRFWANDTAGNVVTTTNYTLRNNDTTAPAMNLTYTINGVYYESSEEHMTRQVWGSDYTFNGTVNDEPNLVRINYTITNRTTANEDGGELMNSSWDTSLWTNQTNVSLITTFTKTFNGMYLPTNGNYPTNYTINVSAVDKAGNFNWTAFNITSMPAVKATYIKRITAPGYIGSGTKGGYNFTLVTKGFPWVRMYLDITSDSNANNYFAANQSANARLGRTWDGGIGITETGGTSGYGGAASFKLTNMAASPAAERTYPYNYSNMSQMNNVSDNNLTLFLNPYTGLTAGTYTGTYGFALWDTS